MTTPTLADPTVMVAGLLIGHRRDGRPIYMYTGADGIYVTDDEDGAEDEDDEDDRDDSDDEYIDDEEDDDEVDVEAEAWTPPSQEEWDKVNDATKRNNRENAQYRGVRNLMRQHGIDPTTESGLAALQELLTERTGQARQQTDADAAKKVERSTARAVEKARAEAETQWRGVAAKQAIVAELVRQGLDLAGDKDGAKVTRALRLVDSDGVDFDADGRAIGVDIEVAAVKREFPALFAAPVAPRRSGAADVDGGDKRGSGRQPRGWLSQVDAQITG